MSTIDQPTSPEEKSIHDWSGEHESIPLVDAKAERRLVWRLDLFFLSVGFLGYCFKYLDQTNISNAYVSGMKEDLSLNGNQLNYFTTLFNAGYIIMLYPSCVIVSHFGPSRWLPCCEIVWGVLTCCLSLAYNYKTVYGLRFLIGVFEASAWPTYITIISQWYLPHEVALRMSIYNIAQPTGAMLSGALQGALSTNLDGALGRSGWRWAFIVNGVCTIFVASLAFFALPGYPESPNKLARWYLKDQDIATALARAKRVNRAPQRGITLTSFVRTLTFWQLWAFPIAWAIGGNTTPSNYFNLWLKSLKLPNGKLRYSVAKLNYLPIGGQALALVMELAFSGFSDWTGKRLPFLLGHSVINVISQIILIVRPRNNSAYMAGWYLNYVGSVATMLLCGWASQNLQHEPEVRTVLFATGTVLAYIQSAFIPLAAFPASQAPRWKIGAKLYLAFMLFATGIYVGIHYMLKLEANKEKREVEEEVQDDEGRAVNVLRA